MSEGSIYRRFSLLLGFSRGSLNRNYPTSERNLLTAALDTVGFSGDGNRGYCDSITYFLSNSTTPSGKANRVASFESANWLVLLLRTFSSRLT